jgi:hypothetical protein
MNKKISCCVAGVVDPENLHLVDQKTLTQTLSESKVEFSWDLGNGVTLYCGERYGAPIQLIENSGGELHPIWYS